MPVTKKNHFLETSRGNESPFYQQSVSLWHCIVQLNPRTPAPMQPQFDAKSYLKERFQSPQMTSFTLKYCYSVFSKYHGKWDPSKATLLKLGGGPSLQIAIVGAPFFSSIIHSDFNDSCNKEVQLWVDRSPDAFNWTPAVEYSMKHCEGEAEREVDSHTVMEREEEVRRKISAVVHCDATQENVGLPPGVIPDGGFDVVTARACLTCGARTKEEFVQELKNVRSVLKVGGYLCALISGRTPAYKIASEDKVLHPIVYLTDSDVREGIVEAELCLEEFQSIPIPPSSNPGGVKEVYVCLASR